MSEPLTRPAPAAAAAAPAPAAAQAPAPAVAEAEVDAAEPGLFDDEDAARVAEAATDRSDDGFDPVRAGGDDPLPRPAYEPRIEEDDLADFVAPTARPVGAPSQEALDRLRTAVAAKPAVSRPAAAGPMPKPATAPAAADDQPKRGRFSDLIGRMTGGSGETPQHERRQPEVRALHEEPDADIDPDQEKIEIPAFLRRQAN